jgi:hypothetical protein
MKSRIVVSDLSLAVIILFILSIYSNAIPDTTRQTKLTDFPPYTDVPEYIAENDEFSEILEAIGLAQIAYNIEKFFNAPGGDPLNPEEWSYQQHKAAMELSESIGQLPFETPLFLDTLILMSYNELLKYMGSAEYYRKGYTKEPIEFTDQDSFSEIIVETALMSIAEIKATTDDIISPFRTSWIEQAQSHDILSLFDAFMKKMKNDLDLMRLY